MSEPYDTHSLKIVMAASEAVPYAKTGGLADVVGALPGELARLGHDVTLILPRYRSFHTHARALRVVGTISVQTAKGLVDATLEEELLPTGSHSLPVRILAVRHDPYFDREGLYQGLGGDYPDNLDRFVFFSRAILEVVACLAKMGQQTPHVLHLHDWQTALCAVYVKTVERHRKEFQNIKTVLTLHNVGYQGLFPGNQFAATGLPDSLFTPAGLEFYGSVNLLKGGMIFADVVSTVSPTYAKEIMTSAYGFGLEGVLAGRKDGVLGITNGIDVEGWNPETDASLPARYSKTDLSGKRVCKRALQQEVGLPNSAMPLMGVIGRLTSQKGFDLLVEIIPELMALGVQLVILGTGDRDLEGRFREAQARYPQQIGLSLGFDEGLAHRVEAGADIVVMPSRYEPCGLTQLYSLRYGTVPIVRKTGGLADTVVPYKPSTLQAGEATGFHFDEISADALLSVVLLALKVYEDEQAWRSLQQAGMSVDSSWARAAREYTAVFRGVAVHR
ncbi:MAG: glycogen synthase GlgA [Nitrospira sp.]|jgi:starch synthase|nr:glycogen synthase GlgA [Nitrospira sp.]